MRSKYQNFSLRDIVLASLFIAISVSLGKLLESVPNVELISFSVWMSGYLLNRRYSTLVGFLSFTLYSLLSPYGVAPLPLLFSQALGGSLFGYFGGWLVRSKKIDFRGYLLLGILLTFSYDCITNVGGFISFSENRSTLLVYLVAGLPFALIHIGSNGLSFMILTPLLKKAMDG